MIVAPQVLPELHRQLFALILEELEEGSEIVNEVIEVTLEGADGAVLTRYFLAEA
ncbi:hypothetical protein ILFOPFJJ_06523 [Ensifer psoraleae]|uniref:hypothetical protein n=1 Tax=Sinorhizobium psoraleae TaxID=520838 RepID=UPI001FE29FF7|nr:hypothetical protein [Sinorhizobium psoraleae]NRP75600.1 hypothetical protein [Sinorhizobium psoraleae]